MSKFSLSSLRSRALVLVLLAIFPVLALTLYSYFDQRDRAIHEVQKDELFAAKSLATIQETLINESRQLLETLAQLPQVQRRDRGACNALFAKLLTQGPYLASIVATDPEGELFAGAPAVPGPVNYADRAWFQKVKQTRDFVVGELVLGRTSHKYGIILAYPIVDGEGRFQGALPLQVDLNWMGTLLARTKLPPATALVMSDSSHKVLFRYPEPENYIGKMLPDALVKIMTGSDAGVAAGVGLPGDQRLFAFTRLSPPWQELRVSLGVPMDWAVGPVNRILWRNLIWLGLVALFALATAWYGGELFVVHPVKKLRGVTDRLAAGDLTVRAGPQYPVGELGLLAHSFDQMADSLQERGEALRESEERFRTMANAMPQLAWIAESDGYIFWYNQRWYDYTGTTPEEMEGWGWQSVHDPEMLPQVLEQWKASIATGEPFEMVFPLRGGDGQFRQFLTRGVPLKDANGQVIQWFGTNTDITKRQQAEEKLKRTLADLERSNRDLEDFAYISSHDLQEPLRKIANFSEMLAQQYREQLDERAVRYFGYVTDGAKRMQTLINDLLSYSRVGRAEMQLIPAPLEDILKVTLDNLHGLIKENHAEISYDPLPTMKVNPHQMGQLLQNLLTNAIKFQNNQPPRIHLSARRESREWLVSIHDNGIGFEPQYAENIFKVFKRLHSKEQYPGTGIGLAICKKIIERHGGRIWAESEPGRGATFYFTIPA